MEKTREKLGNQWILVLHTNGGIKRMVKVQDNAASLCFYVMGFHWQYKPITSITNDTIKSIVKRNPTFTGRDQRNTRQKQRQKNQKKK